ncbi:hypothetical protein ARTHRO9V_160093 [Arthrobacter sp. 9V]|nr:hypothetical protein ARTHRO9V_160093 [Arthrobacter sp. 9V]
MVLRPPPIPFFGSVPSPGFDRLARHAVVDEGLMEFVDNVHTFHRGLPRSAIESARIPHVSATSQCFQGSESRSSPTSGTAYPLVRGGFCF